MTKDYRSIGQTAQFRVHATPLVFEAQHGIRVGGFLPDEMGAYACWYYYLLADKMMDLADESDQIVLEEEPWYYRRFIQLKKSIALIYGLENPSAFEKFWPAVEAEVARVNMPPVKWQYRNASPILKPYGDMS